MGVTNKGKNPKTLKKDGLATVSKRRKKRTSKKKANYLKDFGPLLFTLLWLLITLFIFYTPINTISFMPPPQTDVRPLGFVDSTNMSINFTFSCQKFQQKENAPGAYYVEGEYLSCCLFTTSGDYTFNTSSTAAIKVKSIYSDQPYTNEKTWNILSNQRICNSMGVQVWKGKNYILTSFQFVNKSIVKTSENVVSFEDYVSGYSEEELKTLDQYTNAARLAAWVFVLVLLPQGILALIQISKEILNK